MADVEGGCLCGAVRYIVAEPFAAVVVCHCRHCQRQSGSAYSVNVIVPATAFRFTGEMATYTDRGESGGAVERNFCPACGAPVATRADAAPDVVAIKAGTLDDPACATPVMEIYGRSALPWVQPLKGVVRAAAG